MILTTIATKTKNQMKTMVKKSYHFKFSLSLYIYIFGQRKSERKFSLFIFCATTIGVIDIHLLLLRTHNDMHVCGDTIIVQMVFFCYIFGQSKTYDLHFQK
jgi:hypothetical protein